MGSVLGVAVFGSIAASVFTNQISRLTGGHRSVGSMNAAIAAAHHAGGAFGATVLQAVDSAFVTGADRAMLAGAIAALAGLLVAIPALRATRQGQAQTAAPAQLAATPEVPVPVAVPERDEGLERYEAPVRDELPERDEAVEPDEALVRS